MSILIHLVNGNPQKQDNEEHAGLMLARNEKLGWRCKLTAMPSKRELMRSVSDCPLTIAENILLWSKRHGWKIKLHPNSVSLKQLLSEVKEYTGLGAPETNILAAAMLLKNFAPPAIQEQPGLPNFHQLIEDLQQSQVQQAQMQQAQMQQAQVQQAPNSPTPRENGINVDQPQQKQWVGDGAAKMKRTQERYEQTMAQVNATVAYNERQRQLAEQVTENFDETMGELDELLNEFDNVEIPETFNSKDEAITWSLGLGAFDSPEEAINTYDEIASEAGVEEKELFPIWIESILAIFDEGEE